VGGVSSGAEDRGAVDAVSVARTTTARISVDIRRLVPEHGCLVQNEDCDTDVTV
jgi:hypothetical protein